MIENGLFYLVSIISLVAIALWIEKRLNWRIFSYLPVIVLLYIITMILANIGIWSSSGEINSLYKDFKSYLLPAMILVLLLGSNIKAISLLSKSLIGVFVLSSFSIALGFILAYLIFSPYLPQDAWRTLAALCGSWMGGTVNMVAIGDALGVTEEQMGFALIADSLNYTIWVSLLLLLIPFAPLFNKWTNASMVNFEQIVATPTITPKKNRWHIQIIGMIAIFLVAKMILWLASLLPQIDFFSQTTWVVLISTTIAIIGSLFAWARYLPLWLGKPLLYLLIALIASQASLGSFTQAPLYIAFGTTVLVVHLVLMLLFAKIFKLNLFSLGVASLANIGGVASAPILAGAYAQNLVPIGVIMAMMGYIVGTFGGLAVGKILFFIASY